MAGPRHPAAASPWPRTSQPRAPAPTPVAMLPSHWEPNTSILNLTTICFKTFLMMLHSMVASPTTLRRLRTWRPRMRRGPAPRLKPSMPTSTPHTNEWVHRGQEQYSTGESLPTLARVEISNPGSHITSAPCPSGPPIRARLPSSGLPHRLARAAQISLSPTIPGRIQCWGAPAPEQQPVPGTAAPFPFVMCADHRRRHHLHAKFSPSLANPALVIALQLDAPINKTAVVKSGSSHCQQLRWILWSQVDGPSHCFDQSRPSLHPVLPSQDRPTWFDRPLPPSRRPTVSTERSPRPQPFPRRCDRCDRPHPLDFLAAVGLAILSLYFLSDVCLGVTTPRFLLFLVRVSRFCPSCRPSGLTAAAVLLLSPQTRYRGTQPLASVSAAAVAYLRSVPLRRISNVRHCGAEMATGIGVGGLQTAEASWRSAKTLRVAFSYPIHIWLALLVGLFSSFTLRFVFPLLRVSPGHSLRQFTTTCWIWEENEGIWELDHGWEGFRRGAIGPALGVIQRQNLATLILHFFPTSIFRQILPALLDRL